MPDEFHYIKAWRCDKTMHSLILLEIFHLASCTLLVETKQWSNPDTPHPHPHPPPHPLHFPSGWVLVTTSIKKINLWVTAINHRDQSVLTWLCLCVWRGEGWRGGGHDGGLGQRPRVSSPAAKLIISDDPIWLKSLMTNATFTLVWSEGSKVEVGLSKNGR